jgi:ribosomal protein S27E
MKKTKYYAVKCKSCAVPIKLGTCEDNENKTITFYTTPSAPIICRECGSSHIYGSTDLEITYDEEHSLYELTVTGGKPKKEK